MANVTRGFGLLEGLLARRRATMANRLIPANHRHGRLLDIGCGTTPYFLTRTAFAQKIGVDKVVARSPSSSAAADSGGDIRLLHFDIDSHDALPFDSASIDVVTMLAVFEHIKPARLTLLLDEIERVLKPGGLYVFTTPAGWTGPLLDALKTLRLISPVEIDEHQDSYSRAKIRAVLGLTRWATRPVRMGYFEGGMNIWAVAEK